MALLPFATTFWLPPEAAGDRWNDRIPCHCASVFPHEGSKCLGIPSAATPTRTQLSVRSGDESLVCRILSGDLALTALQWMSGLAIATLLMNQTLEVNRGYATALNTVVSLAAQAASSAAAGPTFERFGSSTPLAAVGCIAATAGLLLYGMLAGRQAALPKLDD